MMMESHGAHSRPRPETNKKAARKKVAVTYPGGVIARLA